MFKFTILLFVLIGLMTSYRVIGQVLSVGVGSTQPILAYTAPRVDASATTQRTMAAGAATPTVAPLFRTGSIDTAALTIKRDPIPGVPSHTNTQSAVTPTVTPTVDGVRRQSEPYPEILIYDDNLNPNWTIEQSVNTQANLWDTTHWFQQLHPQREINSGAASLAVSPQADYGTIFFTVRPDTGVSYKRSDVLGVSFWLNSGSNPMETDDLSVAVLGSNQFTYWKEGDISVFPDKSRFFSETRLYFLQINRTIPPNTWVNVVVWLNQLQYDPTYQYVTGFYIKNDADFRNTYYLDQVALIMAP